jgi:hypothetical protein
VALMYAKGTKTSVESSRAELERTLSRYGADAFSYGADGERAIVAFRVHGKHVKFELRYPPLADFRYTSRHSSRTSSSRTGRPPASS